jgi:hypothetical protein
MCSGPLLSALLPALLLSTALVRPRLAAESMAADSLSPAAVTLARFIAGQEEASHWPLETIEIEASLPKLKKTGRLRAIRRLLPGGHPDYQVLEVAGDSTVKSQLIVRYVSADKTAAEVPSSSLAINSANYKIHYAGTIPLEQGLAYAFRITPRSKREGLVNGMFWLDSETGTAVRESGYLVKNPSIFLKRVNLTRENVLHSGTVEARITHISIETRIVGRAQLVIVERPCPDELTVQSAVAGGR